MPSVTPRIWAQKQIGYFPHTGVSGDAWTKTKEGVCTGNGGAGGTTIVDTGADSGAAETYNGYWIEILDGTYKGECRMVVIDDGAGTLTPETSFGGTIASGVAYRIWQSPDPVVVVTTSDSATSFTASARTEDADEWIGYYLVPIEGTTSGEHPKLISDSSAAGVFTCATFVSTPAVGDVFLLRKFLDVELDPSSLTRDYTPRPGSRLNHSQGDGVLGPKQGTLAFNLPIRPSGSLAAADAEANAAEASGLFAAVGLEEVVQSSVTVDATTDSASAVKIVTGDRENLAIGGLMIWNGNVRRITSLEDGDPDVMNVSPDFPNTPPAGDVIYALRMYKKSTTLRSLNSCGIEVEIDGVRHLATGCKGNVSFDASTAELAFDLQVDNWVKDPTAAVYISGAAYSTVAPVQGHDREFYLDTIATSVAGFTATPGMTTAAKAVQGAAGNNGRAGFHHTAYNCGATFDELMDGSSATLPHELRWTARTAKSVLAIFGAGGNVFGVTMPVARMVGQPVTKNADGFAAAPNVLTAQDAGVALNNATYEKMPDFAFHIS